MSRLFCISDDNVILVIMSWLDLRDHGLLDMALTNAVDRKRWMTCLLSAHYSNTATSGHSHSLLRWLIQRKMCDKFIRCHEGAAVNDRSFVGINNNVLHTLHLSRSRITDTGLLMIAQGCPQLKTVELSYCKRISNKGLLALATNLPR